MAPSGPVTPDAWHHVAFVLRQIDKSDTRMHMALYLDGIKIANGKVPLMGAHPGDINLGRSGNTAFHDGTADNPGFYFAGCLDDFHIVNRAFTDAGVRSMCR